MQTGGVDIKSVGNTQFSELLFTISSSFYPSNIQYRIMHTLYCGGTSLLLGCCTHIHLRYYTQVLHKTALVETFNLKAAIEYQLKNCELSNGAYCAVQSCATAFQ